MSWFTGISGKNQILRKELQGFSGDSLFSVSTDNFYLEAGGLEYTLYTENEQESGSGWVACGVGISNSFPPKYLDGRSWKDAITQGKEYLHSLNGHFAVVSWDQEHISFYTDQFGLRNIFFIKSHDYVLFSTRLDRLLELSSKISINWKKFGSRWLCVNQLSTGSFLEGIERLSQGGYGAIRQGVISLSNKRWEYTPPNTDAPKPEEWLQHFCTLSPEVGQPLSLGLSGGLDSRTIFAALLGSDYKDWHLHTFAKEDHPDVEVARKLNSYYQKEHHFLSLPDLSEEEIADRLPAFIVQNQMTAVPASLEVFDCYREIQDLDLTVIDGGFGELPRGRFLFSLLMRGKQALLNNDIEKILPHFRLIRAEIFTKECNQLMEEGLRDELAAEIQAMPDIEETGIENWLNLFTIRTRVPNTAGPEQARSDAFIFNYMPFLQPDFIRSVLSLPPARRKNAKLFRTIIHQHAPKLEKPALVKGTVQYPYWMKDISSTLWMRLKRKAGFHFKSQHEVEFLLKIETYTRDLANSSGAKTYDAYDTQKVQKLVEGFYDEGRTELAGELNWWLSFEILRRNLNDNK